MAVRGASARGTSVFPRPAVGGSRKKNRPAGAQAHCAIRSLPCADPTARCGGGERRKGAVAYVRVRRRRWRETATSLARPGLRRRRPTPTGRTATTAMADSQWAGWRGGGYRPAAPRSPDRSDWLRTPRPARPHQRPGPGTRRPTVSTHSFRDRPSNVVRVVVSVLSFTCTQTHKQLIRPSHVVPSDSGREFSFIIFLFFVIVAFRSMRVRRRCRFSPECVVVCA